MLLRNDGGKWLIAGFYPKALAMAGHDGLWYWTQARTYAQNKQPWDAWLFYGAAQTLLKPTDFVLSTHSDKLRNEASGATPPPLSDGISPNTPLVIKAAGAAPASPVPAKGVAGTAPAQASSTDFRFTALTVADPNSPESTAPMLSVHVGAEPLQDPTAARQRNLDAARSLLNAYPELRKPFDRIAITTDAPGQPPLTTIVPLSEVK